MENLNPFIVMAFKIFLPVLSLIISIVSIVLTGKKVKITNNQFLFSHRSEINDLFQAILSVIDEIQLHDYSEDKNYAGKLVHREVKGKEFINTIKMEFGLFTCDELLTEVGNYSEALGKENFYEEMNKTRMFSQMLQSKIKQTKDIFSDKEVKKYIKKVLEDYDSILNEFTAIFQELNKKQWEDNATYVLSHHKNIYNKIQLLKETVSTIKDSNINQKMDKDFKLYIE